MSTATERRQHKATLVTRTTQVNHNIIRLTRPTETLLAQVMALRGRLDSVRRNISLLLVYATIFLDFIGVTLLTPGMRFLVDPVHPDSFDDFRHPRCAQRLNASTAIDDVGGCNVVTPMAPGKAVSVMMFTFGLGQLISTPLMGWASDRFGKKKILLISTAGTAAGFLLQGMVWTFWPHSLMRFIGGLFSGSRPVCQAFIAASVPPHKRAQMMGYVAFSVMAAMQFGPVLGGSLSQVSLRLPLFVAAAVAVITLLLLMRYLEEPTVLATIEQRDQGGAASGQVQACTSPIVTFRPTPTPCLGLQRMRKCVRTRMASLASATENFQLSRKCPQYMSPCALCRIA